MRDDGRLQMRLPAILARALQILSQAAGMTPEEWIRRRIEEEWRGEEHVDSGELMGPERWRG